MYFVRMILFAFIVLKTSVEAVESQDETTSCTPIINEVFFSEFQSQAYQDGMGLGNFLELKMICRGASRNDWADYRVLVININENTIISKVQIPLELNNFGKIIVIGSDIVHDRVEFEEFPDVFYNTQYAVVLVKLSTVEREKHNLLGPIEIPNETLPRKVTNEVLDVIKLTVIDVIGVGNLASNVYYIFNLIKPDLTSTNGFREYILKPVETAEQNYGRQIAYSRCYNDNPFQPSSFFATVASPGIENTCCIELITDRNAQRLSQDSGACGNTLPPVQSMLAYNELNNQRELEASFAAENLPGTDGVDLNFVPFKQEWCTLIDNSIPLLDSDIVCKADVQPWIELMVNPSNPANSRYRCKWCNHFYVNKPNLPDLTLDPFIEGKIPEIITSVGALRQQKRNNKVLINTHLTNNNHDIIKGYIADKNGAMEAQKNYLKVTADMFYWVYVQSRLEMSYSKHPQLINALKGFGIDLGVRHFSKWSARKMVMFISDQFHQQLIKKLVKNQQPMTLLLDSSTDVSGKKIILFYFQTLEKCRPVLHFYKALQLQSDTGEEMFKVFTAQIKKDGSDFEKLVLEKTIGFASDGASQNIGKHNGFLPKFKSIKQGKIVDIHCYSHKLQLAFRSVIEEKSTGRLVYLKEFGKNINKLSNYYGSKAIKQRRHFTDLADDLDVTRVRKIQKVFEVRWLPSFQQAFESVVINYKVFYVDLQAAKDGRGYTAAQRLASSALFSFFDNRNTIAHFHFILDILFELAKWAKKLQYESGLLISSPKWKRQACSALLLLKAINGNYLNELLTESKCDGIQCDTLDRFEDSNTVTWSGITVKKVAADNTMQTVSSIRNDLIDSIISNLNSRFPAQFDELFSVFDPLGIPSNAVDAVGYGSSQIESISRMFDVDPINAKSEWSTLIMAMGSGSFLETYKNEPSHLFWPKVLLTDTLPRTQVLDDLLRRVLSIPVGTARVESGFSTMNSIKSKYRNSLGVEGIDEALRVILNGPSNFKTYYTFTDLTSTH